MKLRLLIKGIFIAFFVFYLTPLIAQTENKTVVITVSGSGKTQEEAKQNALRNAIEQAFGTFISSNTQILNDELVKDEIVSVSSGNIQEYSVLSEVLAPDGYWSNTVKAKVAIDKLTTFCESKGVNIEFKGSLFALNVKQQILNEENELKAITNMCKVLKEISEKSFDYEIAAGEPVSSIKESWEIPLTITAKTNDNFKIMSDYLSATLRGLSLTREEVGNYIKLKKSYKTILFCPLGYQPPIRNKRGKIVQSSTNPPSIIYLRKNESWVALLDYIAFFRKSLLNFALVNDIRIIQGEELLNTYRLKLKEYSNFLPVYSEVLGGGWGLYKIFNGEMYRPVNDLIYDSGRIDFNAYCKLKDLSFDSPNSNDSKFFPFLSEIDANSVLGEFGQIDLVISFWLFNAGYTAAVLSYEDRLTLEQLGKISGYKIETIK